MQRVIQELDHKPRGLDVITSDDPMSAAMYSHQRAAGMKGHYRAHGRLLKEDQYGKKSVRYSKEQKAEWEQDNKWRPCRR